MDQSTRQNLITAFNTVLRTSALVGKIDQQRTSLAFAALLQNLPDGENVVPLGPIYDFLQQQKAPEAAIREVLVILQSREARFGVRLELPPQLRSMSDEERAKIVLMASAMGPAPANASKGRDAEPPPPAEKAAPTGFVPDKRKKGDGGTRNRLVIGMVVAIAGLVASIAYNEATKVPPPAALTINDANALPCVELLDVPAAFSCFAHDAYLAATSRDELKARAEATRAAAVARGLPTRPVQILSLEKRSLQYVFP